MAEGIEEARRLLIAVGSLTTSSTREAGRSDVALRKDELLYVSTCVRPFLRLGIMVGKDPHDGLRYGKAKNAA